MIPSSQDFSNVLERFVRHGTAQIHYDLTRMRQLLAPLLSGQIFRIDKMKYTCRAASSKVSGGGIRYTVMIHGKETFLFSEGNKWFVEAKKGAQ